MVLSRRILAAAGGSGAFTPPPETWVSAGNLVLSGSPVTVDDGAGYKAFPGLCLTSTGSLLLVYRHGSAHISADGHIVARTSDDGGATWSAAYTVYDPADDARDPSVTLLSDDRIALTTFRYNGSAAYQVEVLYSDDDGATFGAPVVADKFYAGNGVTYAYAACSAPIVEVSPSLLLLPVYMRNSTGANWNAFVIPSVDGGDTFTGTILIATGGSKSWTEPWITRLGDGKLLCLIRVDNLNDAYLSTSVDDGSTWPAAAFKWDGDSRNATLLTRHGALFTTGRNGGVQGQYGTSWNDGGTWAARANLPSPSTNYQYGAIAQIADGTVVLVWSQEVSASDADLYLQAFDDTGP
jgi:Neuraminidase (sialidase)